MCQSFKVSNLWADHIRNDLELYHEDRGQPDGKFVASNAMEIPPQHFPDSRRVRLAKGLQSHCSQKKAPRVTPRGWDGGGNLSLFLKKECAYYSTSTYLF